MDDCFFCKAINKKIDISRDVLFDDDKVLILLDIDDAVKGHSLVIWKEHAENASDLSEGEFLHFSKVFHNAEKVLLSFLQVEKSVVLKSGGLISHFHFHIYPVSKDIEWKKIRDIFEKKVKYEFKNSERGELISELRKLMSS